MKSHIVALLIAVLPLSVLAGEPYSLTLVTNEVSTIVAKRGLVMAQAWATNSAYTQGEYVENNNLFFMALVGGTSTNDAAATGPSVSRGTETDNDITWLSVPRKPRATAFVIRTDAVADGGVGYLAPDGFDPSQSAGIPLGSQYASFKYEGQGEVRAIPTGTNLVTISVTEVEER